MEEIRNAESKIFSMTDDQLRSWIQSFKPEENDPEYQIKHYRYVLVQLKALKSIDFDFNLQQLEDVYQQLMIDDFENDDEANIPLELKMEFLLDFIYIFVGNCHLTRAQNIVNKFEQLASKHADNKEVCKNWILCILMQSIKTFCLKDDSASKNFELINRLIEKFQFEDEDKQTIDFYLLCMQLNLASKDKDLEKCSKLVEICINKKNLLICRETLYFINSKIDKNTDSKAEELILKIKEVIDGIVPEDMRDKDLVSLEFFYIGFKRACWEYLVDKMNDLIDKLNNLFNYWETRGVLLREKIQIYFDIIQNNVLEYKKKIEVIFNKYTQDDFSFIYRINLFELVCYYRFCKIQSINADISHAERYLSKVESDLLTYINFCSNYFQLDYPELHSLSSKGYSKLREIDIGEANEIRIKLILLHCKSLFCLKTDAVKILEGISTSEKEIANMIEIAKTHENVDKFLINILKIYLPYKKIQTDSNQLEIKTFVNYSQLFVELCEKFGTNNADCIDTCKCLMGYYSAMENKQLAFKYMKICVKFADELKHERAFYLGRVHFDIFDVTMLSDLLSNDDGIGRIVNYMQESERIYGKNNENYIHSLKEYSVYLLARGSHQEAYTTCLEAFDLAKNLFGSYLNMFSSELLVNMGIAKRELGQIEDMKNIFERAKHVEEKINSKTSPRYKQILAIENSNQERLSKKKSKRKQSVLKKLAPNTPLKLGIYIGVVAVAAIGLAIFRSKSKNTDVSNSV